MKINFRNLFIWIGIFVISFLPVLFWSLFGVGVREAFSSYDNFTHSLGVVFGLVGMTMFALTFVFSTRIKWVENLTNGLDKAYLIHGILGGTALIFILAHPIFLILKFVPEQMNLAAAYLLPGSHWSVNFGIVGLVGLIGLIFVTLFAKLKYNVWKFSHGFLGLVFFLAVLHIFLVRGIAQGNIFVGYFVYAVIVSVIGLFSFCYSLFFHRKKESNVFSYVVESVHAGGDFFEIVMVPKNVQMNYESGQFIFVKFFNKNLSREAHPFSVASASNSRELKIVVKKLGDYTSKLGYLEAGDLVSIEGPYGRFSYRKYLKKNQVWIAAGVGVTPFIGMAQDVLNDGAFRGKVDLIYSVRDKFDLIDNSIFEKIEGATSKFRYFPWFSGKDGRLDVKSVFGLVGDFKDKEFFLCGPKVFKEDLIGSLVESGVSKEHIHEEVFDLK